MSPLRPAARYAAALLLFLQCVLPAFVSVADAWATRGGSTAAHAEQLGGPGTCATVHQADCELCAFVHMAVSTTPLMQAPAVAEVAETRFPATACVVPDRSLRAGFSSRAPPSSTA